MAREAKPRWTRKPFDAALTLYLRGRPLGSVVPLLSGECRYATPSGKGVAADQAEAMRLVEAASTSAKRD